MTKGLQRSLSRAPVGRVLPGGGDQPAALLKKTIVVNAPITVDGATGVGFGSIVAGDFPEGNIRVLGVLSYLSFTGPTSANLVDTWNGDFGIGSTPASDATITAGDVDLTASTAIGPATAEAIARARYPGIATPVLLDNTDGSLEVNLNLLVDDADIDADGVLVTAAGEITIEYTLEGDD